MFLGFNRFGSLGMPMSPRGVEMLVRLYGSKLGFPELTPRVFRHSIILNWFSLGISQTEIQAWLGLKTTYAFRSYIPLIEESKSLDPSGRPHPVSEGRGGDFQGS